jgi:hypothetical protein
MSCALSPSGWVFRTLWIASCCVYIEYEYDCRHNDKRKRLFSNEDKHVFIYGVIFEHCSPCPLAWAVLTYFQPLYKWQNGNSTHVLWTWNWGRCEVFDLGSLKLNVEWG